jgi:hypothetical protein
MAACSSGGSIDAISIRLRPILLVLGRSQIVTALRESAICPAIHFLPQRFWIAPSTNEALFVLLKNGRSMNLDCFEPQSNSILKAAEIGSQAM